jgi:hypothetical protein
LKPTRHKKLLGLAIGERSLLAAEVVAGDTLQVRKVAEMQYPPGVSPSQPVEMGAALGQFLRDQGFTARVAVVGIPVKWLVVKPKEVPPADANTLAPMLRLQAEAEFSSELKDLVYDFTADDEEGGVAKSVLLMATQRKFIESARAFCEAARVQAIAVTPSALVLGEVTGQKLARNVLVLAVSANSSELTSQRGAASGAIRHLRGATPQPAFISELRRAVSTLPSETGMREMILWDGAAKGDTPLNAAALGEELGVKVNNGELPNLGVDASIIGLNGDSARFAAAISLAISGINGGPTVDFLHSRLAPPKERTLPPWALSAALALFVVFAVGYWAYGHQQEAQKKLDDANARLLAKGPAINEAKQFVGTAGLAQYWHTDDGRFVDLLRDLTSYLPDDNNTYVTSIEITADKPRSPTIVTNAKLTKQDELHALAVVINGKTMNSDRVNSLVSSLRSNPSSFIDAKQTQGGMTGNGRGQQRAWAFVITFNYVPPKSGATTRPQGVQQFGGGQFGRQFGRGGGRQFGGGGGFGGGGQQSGAAPQAATTQPAGGPTGR